MRISFHRKPERQSMLIGYAITWPGLTLPISAWLAFCPPSGVMSTQWSLVGFIVASASRCCALRSSAFVVHVHLLASSVGLHANGSCESGVQPLLIAGAFVLYSGPLFSCPAHAICAGGGWKGCPSSPGKKKQKKKPVSAISKHSLMQGS